VLVVGPKSVIPSQKYTLTISNGDEQLSSANLNLTLVANDAQKTIFQRSTIVDVRKYQMRQVDLQIPNIAPSGTVKLMIQRIDGVAYNQEVALDVQRNLLNGLIQIDKPVYKPGDMVKFRVIVLDTDLKPPANLKSIQVRITDPDGNDVGKWDAAKLFSAVFENRFQIASSPMFGMWKISASVDEKVLVSKTFEVKEYVLSSFDLQVAPSVIPLEEHGSLELTISANYHFGKPVDGTAVVELFLLDNKRDQNQTIQMTGSTQITLIFNDNFKVSDDQQDVRVKVTFTERHTNRVITKDTQVTVYKYPFRVQLVKESPQFRAGRRFKCQLQFTNHDGTPAKGITGNVEIQPQNSEETRTSDNDGLIKLELPMNNDEQIDITFSDFQYNSYFNEKVTKATSGTDAFLKLELRSAINIKSKRPMNLIVTCSERMSFFVYFVVTKRKIIDSGFIRPNGQTKYRMEQIRASEKMMPRANIIVATVAKDKTVIWDKLEVDFQQFSNYLDIRIDKEEVKPGNNINLELNARSGSYVGLAAYDKGLLDFSAQHHDINWEDVEQLYNGFHANDYNQYDQFHSMGLFVRPSPSNAELTGPGERFGLYFTKSTEKLVQYRTYFPESWLWQNVTIGSTNKHTIEEYVPDTTTSWYLTGFSIDPKHGLGIIKKPIQLTTKQPFYIVESLPYSIKRGEAAVLQFTLFNNLGGEYMADVTLYNVANQTEFVDKSATDAIYKKSLSVPPNVGVPVSFLVKARKLGEMVVRVKASINDGLETDGLEKMIRVLPENLVFNETEPQIFNVQYDENFKMKHNLNINKLSNVDSRKYLFNLYFMDNLEHLLPTPKASAALIVLEYLDAIDSTEEFLKNKAKSMITTNYQEIMKYYNSDGSFSHWPKKKGSIFVTALIAQALNLASKHISEVDVNVVHKAFDWLESKQHSSGRFDEVGEITYQDLQDGSRNGVALTSYVMIALLENSHILKNDNLKHMIDRGVNYVAERLATISDAYDLSLATYAMFLHNHSIQANALDKLVKMSEFNKTSGRYWPRNSSSIETTAYGLLCYMRNKQNADAIAVMNWLVNQREASGSFSHAQATFIGLQALSKISITLSNVGKQYGIKVTQNGKFKQFRVTSTDSNTRQLNVLNGTSKIVDVEITGRGFGMYEIVYEYTVDIRNFSKNFKLELESNFTNSNYTLNLKVCTIFEPTISMNRSNMAIVEVNFPSGFVVNKDSITNLSVNKNPIQNTELRYGQTSLVVYYASLGPEENCFRVTANRIFKVVFHRPSYVLVHDVHHPGKL
uniref:TEP1-F n=1 Tax=Anopheles dirus TaxID=7168 RepID=A0A182NP77_9DIPT